MNEQNKPDHKSLYMGQEIFAKEDADNQLPEEDTLTVSNCDEAQTLIARWDALAASDRMRLAPHLEHCDACRAQVKAKELETP